MRFAVGWRDHLNRVAVVLLVGWVAFDAISTNAFGRRPWPTAMVDFQLIYEFSRTVVETQTYPNQHCFPPSAVALQYGLTRLDLPVAAAVFLASNIAAALAIWWLLARLLGLDRHRIGGVFVLLAYVGASYFFNWEFKSQNCNLHFLLALVLAAGAVIHNQPRAAGFWLALSFAVKLFSVCVIPYLLVKRQYRAFAWAMAFTAIFWVVLPGAVFGPGNVLPVYRSWVGQMQRNARDTADLRHPILISVRNSAHVLTGGDKLAEDRVVNGIWLAWVVVGLAGWRATHVRPASPRDAFSVLTDVSLLTIGPIAVSPYLEPYHAVVVAIPALLLVHAASDPHLARPWRRFAGTLFVVMGVGVSLVPIPWQLRGLWLNGFLLVAMSGLIALANVRRTMVFAEPREVLPEERRRAA